MITKHLFGLIECYSEQGICNFNLSFTFGGGFIIILYLIYIILGIAGLFLLNKLYDKYLYVPCFLD
jgi:uncharacterized membrane protein YuzA (DUF378 family)